jgi:hypothetical protein
MKSYWIAVVVVGMLIAAGTAQTGAAGSASAGASASTGKTSANVDANANAQTSGGSAGASANGQADASHRHNNNQNKNQGGNSSAGESGAALGSGTTIQAQLTKALDAKKAKPGDEVTAKAMQDVKSNGQVVIRKGSTLVGHVTQAQARSSENAESKLGVVFDRALLKDGSAVTLNAMVQALAAAQTAPASLANDDIGMAGGPVGAPQPRMGGGGMGGVTGAVGSTVGGVANTAGSVAGSATGSVGGAVNGVGAAGGTLNSASRGVIGMQGLTLNSASSGSAQGSVISSTTQNVKLDSGTQMVLQVAQ